MITHGCSPFSSLNTFSSVGSSHPIHYLWYYLFFPKMVFLLYAYLYHLITYLAIITCWNLIPFVFVCICNVVICALYKFWSIVSSDGIPQQDMLPVSVRYLHLYPFVGPLCFSMLYLSSSSIGFITVLYLSFYVSLACWALFCRKPAMWSGNTVSLQMFLLSLEPSLGILHATWRIPIYSVYVFHMAYSINVALYYNSVMIRFLACMLLIIWFSIF